MFSNHSDRQTFTLNPTTQANIEIQMKWNEKESKKDLK